MVIEILFLIFILLRFIFFTGKLTDGTKLTWNWLEDVDQEILDNAEYIDSKKYEAK